MSNCPVCNKMLKYYTWYEDGKIQEWLCQCSRCNYMHHYYYGNIEMTIGKWHKNIRGTMKKKLADKIINNFNLEIKKAKQNYKRGKKNEC